MTRLGVIACVITILGVIATPAWADDTAIQTAAKKCKVGKSHLSDGGNTVSFDTAGDDDLSGDSYAKVACVLKKLSVPTYVVDQIDNTRALDGMQKAKWKSYRAQWTFHPDDGLSMTIYEP